MLRIRDSPLKDGPGFALGAGSRGARPPGLANYLKRSRGAHRFGLGRFGALAPPFLDLERMNALMKDVRKRAYTLSGLAVQVFFLAPDPYGSVLGALALQTIAYIAIAGRSPVDGILLVGISLLLVGLLPPEHPMVTDSQYFARTRWVLIAAGAGLILGMLVVILRRHR